MEIKNNSLPGERTIWKNLTVVIIKQLKNLYAIRRFFLPDAGK
jgi:hypothetical protein